MGEWRSVYRVLVGKPEGKRQITKPRFRWKDNIQMDFQEVGCDGLDWIIWLMIETGGMHL